MGPVPDDADQRVAYSAAGTAVARAEQAELRRHSPAELAAERMALRRALAVRPGDEARQVATVARDQTRAACDQATTLREEAARVLDSAEHPRLRRPRAQRVEAARQHLAEADAALGQAVEQLRLATERLAAVQPDAVAEARVPLIQRLEHVNDAIAAHVEEAIASPAPYLYAALGPRSDNPTQRSRWEKAARGLETWRHAELGLGPVDGPLDDEGLSAAIGPAPGDETAALRRQMAIDDLPVEFVPARHAIDLTTDCGVELAIDFD
jgi:hypothetical protein